MHEPFSYPSLDALRARMDGLGITLPLSEDLSALAAPLTVGSRSVHNRLAIQPMEGCDGTPEGAPGELTRRRYLRFAAGGAGLIWFEATAVLPEARANPRQLLLSPGNEDALKALLDDIRETALKASGFVPLIICQLTHSGRYSRPEGRPAGILAYQCPPYEPSGPPPGSRVATDDELRRLEDIFGQSAARAMAVGFDGADVKACHRYLLSELLGAHRRPGPYGGSYENRTRLLRNALVSARQATGGGFIVTTRMNLYDGVPYPDGFGVADGSGLEPDLTEPLRLAAELHEEGLDLINLTLGNPYVNPHVNRPYDKGAYVPGEHALTGVARMMACVGAVKKAVPGLAVISSGHSYLRRFAPFLAAGAVKEGVADMAGFGREAFAYPDFAADILQKGCMEAGKCCVCCSKCTDFMRAGSVTGCVVRDGAVYAPLYKEKVLGGKP